MLKCLDPKIASLLNFGGELVGFAFHPCALTEAVRVHDEHNDVYFFRGFLHLTTNVKTRYKASHRIVGDLCHCPSSAAGAAHCCTKHHVDFGLMDGPEVILPKVIQFFHLQKCTVKMQSPITCHEVSWRDPSVSNTIYTEGTKMK